MRRALQLAAAAVLALALAGWLATGAHRGWTKTSVAIEKTDDVTGLTYPEYEKRFVAGVDLLGAAAALALALAAGSLLVRRPRPAPGDGR